MLAEAVRLSFQVPQHEGPGIDVIVADDLDASAVLDRADAETPDVVLLDIDLGAASPGIDLVEPLTKRGHRVVLFTGSTGDQILGQGLVAGAVGVLRKTQRYEQLLDGIRDAALGRTLNRPAERERLVAATRREQLDTDNQASRLATLTNREREVLGHLVAGLTPERIAVLEVVSISTVRSHIKTILRKLDVNSQIAAVAFARGG